MIKMEFFALRPGERQEYDDLEATIASLSKRLRAAKAQKRRLEQRARYRIASAKPDLNVHAERI
jgi:hypothetical protein